MPIGSIEVMLKLRENWIPARGKQIMQLFRQKNGAEVNRFNARRNQLSFIGQCLFRAVWNLVNVGVLGRSRNSMEKIRASSRANIWEPQIFSYRNYTVFVSLDRSWMYQRVREYKRKRGKTFQQLPEGEENSKTINLFVIVEYPTGNKIVQKWILIIAVFLKFIATKVCIIPWNYGNFLPFLPFKPWNESGASGLEESFGKQVDKKS